MAVNKVVIGNETKIDLSSDTVDAASVLSGKTFHKADGSTANGSMTNQGAVTQTLSPGGSYTIPSGYHNGNGKVTAKANTNTYTFASGDTGGTKDLGASNTYRYINATNVYNKGKADAEAASEWTALIHISTIVPKLFNQNITITKTSDYTSTLNMSTSNNRLYNQNIDIDKTGMLI